MTYAALEKMAQKRGFEMSRDMTTIILDCPDNKCFPGGMHGLNTENSSAGISELATLITQTALLDCTDDDCDMCGEVW